MTVLERAARMHYEQFPLYMVVDGGKPVLLPWDVPGEVIGISVSEDVKERHRNMVRVVLAAVRLPGDGSEVEDAGINTLDAVMPEDNNVDREHFVAAFNAVIDGILEEKP